MNGAASAKFYSEVEMSESTLRDLRNQKGLSQEDLAGEIGKSRTTISNWETGKHDVGQGVVSDLADALDTSEEQIRQALGAPQTARERAVTSQSQLSGWQKQVRQSDLDFQCAAIATSFADFWSKRGQVSVFTIDELCEQTGCPRETVEACWKEIVQSPFVYQVGEDSEVRWVFVLQFRE